MGEMYEKQLKCHNMYHTHTHKVKHGEKRETYMQYSLPSITSLLNLKQQSAQLLDLKMWRKIEIKIRIENRLSFLCLVILIIDHIRWHAFIIKTPMMTMWSQICMDNFRCSYQTKERNYGKEWLQFCHLCAAH